jgi:AcrR family transcriptional regulator
MSPAPARTSSDRIVAAGRELLEEQGLAAVSMAAVAERVGVRPPSLYKHVEDRQHLLAAILASAARDLTAALEAAEATGGTDAPGRARAIASAYRAFARRSPRTTALLFADLGPDVPVPQRDLALAAGPVLAVANEIAGTEAGLAAARALTAFIHGFTSMEQAGAFRLGGDIEEAFSTGIEALLDGLAVTRRRGR